MSEATNTSSSVRDTLSVEEHELLNKMSANPRIKQLLASPSLRAILQQVLEAKKARDEGSFQRLEREIRAQAQHQQGIRPQEETFLADFALQSDEFKELVKELLDTVIE